MRPEGNTVLELLGEVLVDGLAALQDGPSILEALNLLEYETGRVNLVLPRAIYRYYALPGIPLRLLLREYFDLRAARPLDDVSDHVAL